MRVMPHDRPGRASRFAAAGMKRQRRFTLMPATARLAALVILAFDRVAPGHAAPVDYAQDIQPIFAKRCYECHGPEKSKSDLRLNNRVDAFTPAKSGDPAILPGNSAKSPIIEHILSEDPKRHMPPKGERVSPPEV